MYINLKTNLYRSKKLQQARMHAKQAVEKFREDQEEEF